MKTGTGTRDVQGQSPRWGLGSPESEDEAVCRHCFTHIDCRNDQNLKFSYNSPLTLDQCFAVGGDKRHFAGQAPKPMSVAVTAILLQTELLKQILVI